MILKNAVGEPCPWCGTVMAAGKNHLFAPSRDHIVPRSRLPKGTKMVTAIVCRDCNNRKKDFTLSEWYGRLPKKGHDKRRANIEKWLNNNPPMAKEILRLEAMAFKSKSGRVTKAAEWARAWELT